jgi:hypothetical protein
MMNLLKLKCSFFKLKNVESKGGRDKREISIRVTKCLKGGEKASLSLNVSRREKGS